VNHPKAAQARKIAERRRRNLRAGYDGPRGIQLTPPELQADEPLIPTLKMNNQPPRFCMKPWGSWPASTWCSIRSTTRWAELQRRFEQRLLNSRLISALLSRTFWKPISAQYDLRHGG